VSRSPNEIKFIKKRFNKKWFLEIYRGKTGATFTHVVNYSDLLLKVVNEEKEKD
jgi:hypothetical protein